VEPPAADSDDQYDIELPGQSDWGQHSLPAGHAANVIACASFLNHRFAMGVVEPALYLVSTGVGVGRLVDRRHWTSDTVLGMVFGYAIGKEVAKRSSARADKRAMQRAASLSSFYITPAAGGLSAGWRSTF
jgi:membrane-associated phospholipid phosphatase